MIRIMSKIPQASPVMSVMNVTPHAPRTVLFINTFCPITHFLRIKKDPTHGSLKQGYKDSNLEMTESESVALPFGDSPIELSHLKKATQT